MRNEPASKYPMAKLSRREVPPPLYVYVTGAFRPYRAMLATLSSMEGFHYIALNLPSTSPLM